MANSPKTRYNSIQEAAIDLVASFGIGKYDAISSQRVASGIMRGWAYQLIAQFGITMPTARQHIARVIRRQRDPNWQPPAWGGAGRGQGRK